MKIGIIIDNIYGLSIMNMLSKYDHEYHIYIDNKRSFWWDKNREIGIKWVSEWIKYLESKWVYKIILPPTYEMAFLLDDRYKHISQNIANIYISYLHNLVAKYSIVGKLWFLGDSADMEYLDLYISQILSDFKPSANQLGNKNFMKPFWIYRKLVPLWKYLSNHLSANNVLLNNIIKTDLKKIKSYNIDTLVPLNYAYMIHNKSIKHYIGKIRFHDMTRIEEIWKWLGYDKSEYSVNIYMTDNNKLLISEKKRKWLLCRGKSIEWNVEMI